MKLTYQGRVYEYREDRMPLVDAIAIKHHTGQTPKGFYEGIGEMDPDSLRGLVFLALRHAGESPKWDDIDFDIMDLAESIEYSRSDEVPPTAPTTGTPQWPDDGTTSPASPTT